MKNLSIIWASNCKNTMLIKKTCIEMGLEPVPLYLEYVATYGSCNHHSTIPPILSKSSLILFSTRNWVIIYLLGPPYPEIPWNTFDFPDPECSSLSSRRAFCSRLKALFKTVTMDQLLKKIVPWCNRGLQRECWIQYPWKNLTRIICPEITRSFHIFPV